MTSRFLWHASRCDERLHVLLATRRASWNGRQKPEATFLAAFGTPSSSLIKLFTRLGEISVCSLWMHIRSLRMAIQRLWMHVPRLRTKIAVRCVNNCSTLHKQSQHAANRAAPRYGNRLILLEAFTLSRQTAADLCKNAGKSRSQLPSPPFAKRKENRSTAPGNPFRSKKHPPARDG